jgi:hypothetical protein
MPEKRSHVKAHLLLQSTSVCATATSLVEYNADGLVRTITQFAPAEFLIHCLFPLSAADALYADLPKVGNALRRFGKDMASAMKSLGPLPVEGNPVKFIEHFVGKGT